MNGRPALRIAAGVLVTGAIALAGCPTPPLPAGNLADPGALTAVSTQMPDAGGSLVFVAEGDGQDLRAFIPATHHFVLGPNAINALSITLQTSAPGGLTLPSFRAQQIAGPPPPPICQPGETLCTAGPPCATGATCTPVSAFCAATSSDVRNCGACNQVCAAGEVCSAGACVAACTAGETLCTPGTGTPYCTDLSQDPANCGACGVPCITGTVCVGGTCWALCPPGQTQCTPAHAPAFCSDTATDAHNCGSCGMTCAAGQACVGGACSGTCPAGMGMCGGVCTDVTSDSNNCGVCGTVCPAGSACFHSVCMEGPTSCKSAQTLCTPSGAMPKCVDETSDPANCGECGVACPAGTGCTSSVCTPDAGTPGTNPQLGWVAVAGTANRVAVVDAQTLVPTVAQEDASICEAGGPTLSVSCLPSPAFDVAATSRPCILNPAASPLGCAYALLAPNTAGGQFVVPMAAKAEGVTATSFGHPVLVADGTPIPGATIPLPPGQFTRMTISNDGATLYLADTTPGTTHGVTELDIATGKTVAIPTAGPVRVAVPNPPDAAIGFPADAFLFAVLINGQIQTLDNCRVTTNAPAVCPGPALDGAGNPLSPMDFSVPSMDVIFAPFPGVGSEPVVKTGAGSSLSSPGLAFVALGDGTVATIFPDQLLPKIYRPLFSAQVPPTISPAPTVPFTDSAGTPAQPVQLTNQTTSQVTLPNLTTGITQSETISVIFEGLLPGFEGRPAFMTTATSGAPVLADPGAFGMMTTVLTPAEVGDIVRITSLGMDCPGVQSVPISISAIDPATGSATLCVPGDPSAGCTGKYSQISALPCVPQRVAYDLLAAADPPGPWVVAGSLTGFRGRTETFPACANGGSGPCPGTPFISQNTQFFYPNPCAILPTGMIGGCVGGGAAFAFLINSKGPGDGGMDEDATNQGSSFTFSTASGLGPFILSSTASTAGLAYSLAAVPDFLYVSVTGSDSLTEINYPNNTAENSVNNYQ